MKSKSVYLKRENQFLKIRIVDKRFFFWNRLYKISLFRDKLNMHQSVENYLQNKLILLNIEKWFLFIKINRRNKQVYYKLFENCVKNRSVKN